MSKAILTITFDGTQDEEKLYFLQEKLDTLKMELEASGFDTEIDICDELPSELFEDNNAKLLRIKL